jgi:O-antigen/teichoic acid export membrane protein
MGGKGQAGKPGEKAHPDPQRQATDLDDLGARASTGVVWIIVGLGSGQVIRFISNILLTRLLVPEYFGLMALVNVFLQGLELFSDIGIGPALIQNKREDEAFVNTVWTSQAVRGVGLCLVAAVLSGPFASFYEEPLLASLIRVMALTALIRGFTSTSIFTATRHLHLKGPALVRLFSQLAGAIAMLGYAWATRSVWSLVLAGIVGAFLEVLLSHVWLPGIRNRFWFERRAARALLSFGVWVFLGTIAGFVAAQADRLVLGKLITMSALGVYSIAVLLAAAPVEALSSVSMSVLFPLYSRLHYSSHNLSEAFDAARRPVIIIGGWVTSGLVGGGPTIVRLLYDSRYWEAGWILQVLSGCLWFGIVLGGTRAAVALAVGRSDLTAAMAFSKVVGMVVLVPIGYSLGGANGAIAAFALSELVRYSAALVATVGLGFDERLVDFTLSLRVGVASLLGWATTAWLTRVGLDSVPLHAFAVFVVATMFWARPLSVLVNRLRHGRSLFSIKSETAHGTN